MSWGVVRVQVEHPGEPPETLGRLAVPQADLPGLPPWGGVPRAVDHRLQQGLQAGEVRLDLLEPLEMLAGLLRLPGPLQAEAELVMNLVVAGGQLDGPPQQSLRVAHPEVRQGEPPALQEGLAVLGEPLLQLLDERAGRF